MAIIGLNDFSDITDAVREVLGYQSTDTTNINKIKRFINEVYADIIQHKNWEWIQGEHVFKHQKPFTSGTCSVTPESTTVTLSSAPGASDGDSGSFLGYRFSVDGFNEVYTITSHTALSTSITLDSQFLGTLNATAAFQIWRDRIDLPTDAESTVDVFHDRASSPLIGYGRSRFEQEVLRQGRKVEAFPQCYSTTDYYDPSSSTAELETDRYRQTKIHPSITPEDVTIRIVYNREITKLDLDADEPILPVNNWQVIVYGATAQAARALKKDIELAESYERKYQNLLTRMSGKVSDSMDNPSIRPNVNWVKPRGRGRIGRYNPVASSQGGSGSASPPTYAKDITIEGGTVTANIDVSAGITIDGRDISADGTTLDSLSDIAQNLDTPNRVVVTDASSNLEESTITTTELEYLDGVTSQLSGNDDTATLTSKTLTDPVLNGDLSGTAILDEDNMASDSATKVPTQQSVKAYVDAQITAEDLDVTSDSGTIAIDLDSETLDIAGGTGIDTSAATNTVTVAIDSTVTTNSGSQTLTNKTLTSPVINTGVSGTAVLDDDTMATASSTTVATSESIKAYVDSQNPMTTGGDIIYGGASGAQTRLANGSSGQVLTSSGGTSAPTWSSVSVTTSVVTKTTTYTATTSDNVILADTSGGAWTLTLYAASGNSGKKLLIKKTTSDWNILTIDGNSAETIDGTTTRKLVGEGEYIELVCDGSNWHILSRKETVDSKTFSITTSWDSWATVTSVMRKEGKWAYFDVKWAITSSGSLSGNLEITAIGSLTVDTSKLSLNVNSFIIPDCSTTVRDAGVATYLGRGQYLDSSGNIRPGVDNDTGTYELVANITSTVPHTFANTDTINFRVKLPISEWDE